LKEVRVIFYINGKRGYQILTILHPIVKEVLVVLPDGPENDDAINYCRENGIGVLFRTKKESLSLPVDSYDSILCCNFPFPISDDEKSKVNDEVFNVHEGILPWYAGNDTRIWGIINGEVELGITIHKVGPNFWDGEIIGQEKFLLKEGMWHKEIDAAYFEAYEILLENWAHKRILNKTKSTDDFIFWRKRKPVDCFINWKQSGRDIYNFIRAQAGQPYHAFSLYNVNKYIFNKVSMTELTSPKLPGTVVTENEVNYIVTGDGGLLRVDEYDFTGEDLMEGMVLH
jgi:methionyl-tRNA formyltransferase